MNQVVSEHTSSGWHAELHLGFRRRPDKTVLARRTQLGPLAVQRPFYPEGDVCHLYLLHPPGGVVGGDSLQIHAHVETGSALVTTPGATKFYRSAGDTAAQTQILRVDDQATLEWLPQENIYFPGTRSQLNTRIELHGEARFIGWEIHCLGRPVNEERFESGELQLHMQIYRDGLPLLLERLRIQGKNDLDHVSGLRSHAINATMIATHGTLELLEELQQRYGENERMLGITLLDDLIVCRYLGHATEQARKLFTKIWQTLRPHSIGREACTPRIWNT